MELEGMAGSSGKRIRKCTETNPNPAISPTGLVELGTPKEPREGSSPSGTGVETHAR